MKKENVSLYDYYAAHAPETIPDWYVHKSSLGPIKPNTRKVIYDRCALLPIFASTEACEKAIQCVEGWVKDPCFFLLKEYEELVGWKVKHYVSLVVIYDLESAWKEYWTARRVWEEKNKASRYFQWRLYYADIMTGKAMLDAGLGVNSI